MSAIAPKFNRLGLAETIERLDREATAGPVVVAVYPDRGGHWFQFESESGYVAQTPADYELYIIGRNYAVLFAALLREVEAWRTPKSRKIGGEKCRGRLIDEARKVTDAAMLEAEKLARDENVHP